MTEIAYRKIGTTSIGIARIAQGEKFTRRQREREAVAMLASEMLGCELRHDEHGAPKADGCEVSVTHSLQIAALACDPQRKIGIDAEEWREALRRVQGKFVRPAEASGLSPERLLALWTIKEAVFKAAGNPRLTIADVECAPALDRATADGREFCITSFWEGSTYVTLAVESGQCRP